MSEHVSLKLGDNNPNIVDLSDLNRPTKLVEKFSAIYDDEWTAAFESLAKLPEFAEEKIAIRLLLSIVQVNIICRREEYTALRLSSI